MTEISHSEVLQLLGLPVDGGDRELATALAGKVGARGPERDDTVRYLVAVVGVSTTRSSADRTICSTPSKPRTASSAAP